MYGVGFSIFYCPILSFVNEFWIERMGMPYGILGASSGVSGVGMPFALEAMLNKYVYPTTLWVIAIGLAVLTGPLIPLLKGRLPPSEQSSAGPTDWTCLKNPLFWVYCNSISSTLGISTLTCRPYFILPYLRIFRCGPRRYGSYFGPFSPLSMLAFLSSRT